MTPIEAWNQLTTVPFAQLFPYDFKLWGALASWSTLVVLLIIQRVERW